MSENRERNLYRVVVLIIVVVGGLAILWAASQGSSPEIGDQGIFQFFRGEGTSSWPGQEVPE